MLHFYDDAIAKDLSDCINPSGGANSIVRIIDSEGMIGLIAEMKEDKVSYPFVCLTRNPDSPIDTSRTNFTSIHRGVPEYYDSKTNTLYMEKCIPVSLKYTMQIVGTNTADVDEFVREILFRYSSVYYIIMTLPYESKRKVRFGVRIDPESIKRDSGSAEYIKGGSLYQTSIDIDVQGAVLLSYTPKHMERFNTDRIDIKPQ